MKAGDFASWTRAGGVAKGRVVSVHTASTVPAVGASPRRVGTEDAPVARVLPYDMGEDGTWTPGTVPVSVSIIDLTPIEALPLTEPTDDDPEIEGTHTMPITTRSGRRHVEHRMGRVEVREIIQPTADTPAQAWIRVNDYTLTDSYGTRFAMGGAKAYLNANPNRPMLLYGHGLQGGITSVLGHGVAWREDASGLDICFQFSDFDAVPHARQAFAQLQDGTFDSFSVGFIRLTEHRDETNNCTVIDTYELPETSIVIEASNGGTKLLALSGQRGSLSDRFANILTRFAAGEIDLTDALVETREVCADVEYRADGDMVTCPTCKGKGKIMDGNRDCPDCDNGKVTAAKADSMRAADLMEWLDVDDIAPEERAALVEYRHQYTDAEKAALGAKGQAMKNEKGDWSYPIDNQSDLDNAVMAIGRGGKSSDAIKAYIMRVAKKLGLTLPDSWTQRAAEMEAEDAALDIEARDALDLVSHR